MKKVLLAVLASASIMTPLSATAQSAKGRQNAAVLNAFLEPTSLDRPWPSACTSDQILHGDFALQQGSITLSDISQWHYEAMALLTGVHPALTDVEIASGDKAVQDYKANIGTEAWCQAYLVEMAVAHNHWLAAQ